ncbi:MAG: citrate synthase family protein [Betaproteobacteria bacterium]|nr:citrate synthase family protein [Betaproteobacteria bacterium]
MVLRESSRTPPGIAPEYITAQEAARLLRVKAQTLYTYVSRGLIRSVGQLDDKRRLYHREDVIGARARSALRRGQGAAAEGAMRWGGQPVIDTAITELTPEGPRYRGRLALELAREGHSFEAVAELLWTGVLQHEPLRWRSGAAPRDFVQTLNGVARAAGRPPILRMFALAAGMRGAGETVRSEIGRGATLSTARDLILLLAGCLGYLARRPGLRVARGEVRVAELASRALLARPSAQSIDAIDCALVLCADHELSSSTFAARVAASTGAELRACVLAALAAHSGSTLGGGCDRAEDLLRDARTRGDVRQQLSVVERAGQRVPGFNLPLYPNGDPRARELVRLARSFAPGNPRAQLIYTFIEEAEQRLGLRPSIEVGLVALAAALNLPERSASALWALGRSAGWIAHVIEQRLAGFVLRPRARYGAAV